MLTGVLIPREDKFIPFNIFFTLRILLAFLRLESLIINFLFPLPGRLWRSSKFDEFTVTSNFLKIISAFLLHPHFLILSGKPVIFQTLTSKVLTLTLTLTL